MPHFGHSSMAKLRTCDARLQQVLEEAIQIMDFTICCGHRSNEEQARLLAENKSQVGPGKSKHNAYPSLAVDIAPYYPKDKIRWHDKEAMCMLYGIIKGIAHMSDIHVRWGGDWDGDNDRSDQTFDDIWHIELVDS